MEPEEDIDIEEEEEATEEPYDPSNRIHAVIWMEPSPDDENDLPTIHARLVFPRSKRTEEFEERTFTSRYGIIAAWKLTQRWLFDRFWEIYYWGEDTEEMLEGFQP